MNKKKTYKRSDKCELRYITVGWNILDDEQQNDLEYIESFPNKAGKIRECVRICRTGQFSFIQSQNENSLSDQLDEYDIMSDQDSVKQMVD